MLNPDQLEQLELDASVKRRLIPGVAGEFLEIDVPADGACMFYCVAFSVLFPHVKNEARFREEFKKIFQNSVNLNEKEIGEIWNLLNYYNGSPKYFQKTGADEMKRLMKDIFRNLLVDYMKEKELVDPNFLDEEDGNPERYLGRMRQEDSRGGPQEMLAFSQMLKIHIQVYKVQNETLVKVEEEYGPENATKIYLVHHNESHYHYLIKPEFFNPVIQVIPSAQEVVVKILKDKSEHKNEPLPVYNGPHPNASLASVDSHLLNNVFRQQLGGKAVVVDSIPVNAEEKVAVDNTLHTLFNAIKQEFNLEGDDLSVEEARVLKQALDDSNQRIRETGRNESALRLAIVDLEKVSAEILAKRKPKLDQSPQPKILPKATDAQKKEIEELFEQASKAAEKACQESKADLKTGKVLVKDALKAFRDLTLKEFNAGDLKPKAALALAKATETLAKHIGDPSRAVVEDATANFHQVTQKIRTSLGLRALIYGLIGAIVGFVLGAMLGAVAGPAAAATAIAGAAVGAVYCASFLGASGLGLGAKFGMWRTVKNDAVKQEALKVEEAVQQLSNKLPQRSGG